MKVSHSPNNRLSFFELSPRRMIDSTFLETYLVLQCIHTFINSYVYQKVTVSRVSILRTASNLNDHVFAVNGHRFNFGLSKINAYVGGRRVMVE